MCPVDSRGANPWRWSITRSRTLHTCPKAFEFGLDRQSSPSGAEARTNLSSIVGVTVHDAIRREIDHWANHLPVSLKRAQGFAEAQLKRVWTSCSSSIVERTNGLELNPGLYPRFQAAAWSQLDRFFRMIWPQFTHYKYEQHEVLSSFEFEGLPMSAKVDLAAWDDNDRLLVVDWKTGQWAGDLADRAQLAFYTLWARNTFRLELQNIKPVLVRIRTGEIIRFEPQEQDLDYVLTLISTDFDCVNRLEESHEFPPSPETRRCWGCGYLQECDEGRALTAFEPITSAESNRSNSDGTRKPSAK